MVVVNDLAFNNNAAAAVEREAKAISTPSVRPSGYEVHLEMGAHF